MSEALQENGAPEVPEVAAETPEVPELGDAGKKAIQSEREARKIADKRADDLAAELKAIKDAQLSDVERAKQSAAESAKELADLRRETDRKTVAIEKGLDADLLPFLTGGSRDEMEAQADILLARINAPKTPRSDPSQGPSGVPPKAQTTAQQFAAAWKD
jgi:hypothetical protein